MIDLSCWAMLVRSAGSALLRESCMPRCFVLVFLRNKVQNSQKNIQGNILLCLLNWKAHAKIQALLKKKNFTWKSHLHYLVFHQAIQLSIYLLVFTNRYNIVKLVTNRWAWELVPERLAGGRSRKQKGRYPWQPWKREPPKGNPSPGAWKMEGPENRVTWNLQTPTKPQAPSPAEIRQQQQQKKNNNQKITAHTWPSK